MRHGDAAAKSELATPATSGFVLAESIGPKGMTFLGGVGDHRDYS